MSTIAVLPVKRFDDAKQRLGETLRGGTRRALAEAMLTDVLTALRRSKRVEAVVVVTSEHGAFTARARVSDEVRRGAVSVTHGWNGAASVGRLTSAHVDCDPLTGMPLQSGVPVTVAQATN